MSLIKFLEKHAGELDNISEVFALIGTLLPFDAADKAKIIATGQRLENAAVNIRASVQKASSAVKEVKEGVKVVKAPKAPKSSVAGA